MALSPALVSLGHHGAAFEVASYRVDATPDFAGSRALSEPGQTRGNPIHVVGSGRSLVFQSVSSVSTGDAAMRIMTT
jgi:hypothetical protein